MGEMTLKNFWVSWYDKNYGKWELHWPWWVSGERLSDDALSAERARVIEMCARLPDDLAERSQKIKLHMGELTAQEERSVKAILRFVAAAIRSLGKQGGKDHG